MRPFPACFLGLVLLLGAAVPGFGFSLNGYSWPSGTQIQMHLQLNSRNPVPFQDGSSSWEASAQDALTIWNQQAETVQFLPAAPFTPSGGDGVNSVFFANDVYGDLWPQGTLAVTLYYSHGNGVFSEAEVIFNNLLGWNSYRGPLQRNGTTTLYDFHRVALHEFGHALGLSHPDQHGQQVTAIMNANISDLDHLADDDIAGARSLYSKPKLTAFLGTNFSYQVPPSTASTTYSASGLPPGLTINSSTGLISGIPTISGTYSVFVTMNSAAGSSKTLLQITVTAPPANPGGALQKLDLAVNRLAADPTRARVYATVPATNSVVVIDTVSLAVIKTIPIGSNPAGLALSADGSKLWVANSGSTTAAIGVIDLESLTALPPIAAPTAASDIEEGLDHRLYVTPATQDGGTAGIMQIDSSTGAFQGRLGGFEIYKRGFVEISPDRKTLYFGNWGISGSTAERFDVSSATPTLLQQATYHGGNGLDLKLSHAGKFLVYPNGAGNGSPPYTTYEIPATDLQAINGMFNLGPFPGPAAFSGDDLFLYEGVQNGSKVDIFDTATFALVGAVSWGSGTTSGFYSTQDVVVENTGARLFVATTASPGTGDLRIFDTGRKNAGASATPAPRSLANVSTRLRVQPGEGALIGGFIIMGSGNKTVVARAIGPSLPLPGALADPTLEIHDSTGALIAVDDNWNSDRTRVLNTGLAPKDEHEAVVVVSLPAGAYTAVLRGAGDTTGIGLVELYDIDSHHSRMANISTRGVVDLGDNVMIGGFIIAGDQPTKIIVRGIGPSLGAAGIANPLPDPVLELHDGNGSLIVENDDWRSTQEEAIKSTGIPPGADQESAIVATLQPGNYTAIVRGKDERTGVALVEIYNLDANQE